MTDKNAPLVRMYWIHALTPLHAGVGSGVGFIDLPIMREKTTLWPVLPGSAVKGVLADDGGDTENRKKDPLRRAAFGIAESSEEGYGSHSGSLVFGDAHLVCLPVRSLYGTFAWLTSPLALQRLKRDLNAAGLGANLADLPGAHDNGSLLVTGTSALAAADGQKAFLADLDFSVKSGDHASAWASALAEWLFNDSEKPWRAEFVRRFAVAGGDTFDFLSETATEVNARVRIDADKKSVARGALWYEEALPAEAILAGLVWCDRDFSGNNLARPDIMKQFCSGTKLLQMGGKATVGRGRVRCVFGGVNA
jgi:CRISPR-associated protein Cmr4